jgi:hypothetical protein
LIAQSHIDRTVDEKNRTPGVHGGMIHRSTFGVQRSAFGVRRSAFGVRRSPALLCILRMSRLLEVG